VQSFRKVGKPWVAVRYTEPGPSASTPMVKQLPPAEAADEAG
jgi:hypothetical protein